jgi:hypothetical protein
MVLYAYVCVCAFSLHRESPARILADKPLLFQGGSVIIATIEYKGYGSWSNHRMCPYQTPTRYMTQRPKTGGVAPGRI